MTPLGLRAIEGLSVIAVASSTGGTWVLVELLRNLSPAGRAALVAQHMEPELVRGFAEWVERVSGWRAAVVEGAAPLRAGRVYLAAGGRDLVLEPACVRALPASGGFVPSGDRLLASVALLGRRATGVVLSGMGADGSAGLAELARCGGRAICQAPATAAMPSMPASALEAVPHALAVPPRALARAVAGEDQVRQEAATARR